MAAMIIANDEKNPETAMVSGDRSRMKTTRDTTATALPCLYTIIIII